MPLQEYTWDDLTHSVSQDQTSVGFATNYSPAPLNNPCSEEVSAPPETENLLFAFQWKAFRLLSPPPGHFLLQALRLSFSFWPSYICISLRLLKHLLSQHGRERRPGNTLGDSLGKALGRTSGCWSQDHIPCSPTLFSRSSPRSLLHACVQVVTQQDVNPNRQP